MLTELTHAGQKDQTYVYAGDSLVARQRQATFTYGYTEVVFQHRDPVTGSLYREGGGGALRDRDEYDPLGANVGSSDPFAGGAEPTFADLSGGDPLYTNGGNPLDKKSGCAINGLPILCDVAAEWYRHGLFEDERGHKSAYDAMVHAGSSRLATTLTLQAPLDMPEVETHALVVDGKKVWRYGYPRQFISPFSFRKPPLTSQRTGLQWLPNSTDISEEKREEIEGYINEILGSQKCLDAFKSAGIMSPADVVGRGLTLGTRRSLFSLNESNPGYGITPYGRREGLKAIRASSSTAAAAITLMNWQGVPPSRDQVNDGKPKIIFNPDHVEQGWFGKAVDWVAGSSLKATVIHEMIHASGAGPRGTLGMYDLSWLGASGGTTEADIQEACR